MLVAQSLASSKAPHNLTLGEARESLVWAATLISGFWWVLSSVRLVCTCSSPWQCWEQGSGRGFLFTGFMSVPRWARLPATGTQSSFGQHWAAHDSLLLSRALAQNLSSLVSPLPHHPILPGGPSLAHRESSWQPAFQGAQRCRGHLCCGLAQPDSRAGACPSKCPPASLHLSPVSGGVAVRKSPKEGAQDGQGLWA